MINRFNRALLFQDSDSEACAKVWSTLKRYGIEYEMSTSTNVSVFGRNLHYRQSMSIGYGGLGTSAFGDHMNYVYSIYVRKKDLAKAKEICDL